MLFRRNKPAYRLLKGNCPARPGYSRAEICRFSRGDSSACLQYDSRGCGAPRDGRRGPGLRPSHHRSGGQDRAGQQSLSEDRQLSTSTSPKTRSQRPRPSAIRHSIFTPSVRSCFRPSAFRFRPASSAPTRASARFPPPTPTSRHPSQPTAYIFGTVSQPLLTLYKINLHVHGEELSVEQSVQELREQRNTVVDDVRAGLLLDRRDPERDRGDAAPVSSNTKNWIASRRSMSRRRSCCNRTASR